MDAVIRRHGQPHYLKIDIENADIVCLRALRNLTVPCHVSAELTEEALVRELVGLGYRRFKLVEQVSHLPIGGGSGPEGWRTAFHYALLTRRAIPYRILRRTLGFQRLARWSRPSRRFPGLAFPPGSSGTFGEDIPSGWISADEVLALWRTQNRIWAEYRRDFWSDVHATP
jgi:hypothetical protein